LTSIFGYASTVLSGWGLGALVQRYDWSAGFAGLIIAAAIGTVLFALAWNAKAHGYDQATEVRDSPARLAPIRDSQ
jgi:OPA family glycerol-3-phosphate transporter-like MFS transporter/OPA family sugar phosphate sensor protein UhpC-like MFS transporter